MVILCSRYETLKINFTKFTYFIKFKISFSYALNARLFDISIRLRNVNIKKWIKSEGIEILYHCAVLRLSIKSCSNSCQKNFENLHWRFSSTQNFLINFSISQLFCNFQTLSNSLLKHTERSFSN